MASNRSKSSGAIPPDSGRRADGVGVGDRGPDSGARGRKSGRPVGRTRVLRFVVMLSILYVGFNVIFRIWIAQSIFFESYLRWNAELTVLFLNVVGENAQVSDMKVESPRFSVEIKSGCDGLQASAFFVFAVLTSPVSVRLRSRIVPMIIGTMALLLLNLVRIISLYYIGIFSPRAFDIMHMDVWQAVFVFLPLLLWVIWARRALRATSGHRDDST